MATQAREQDRTIETTRDSIKTAYVATDLREGNQMTLAAPFSEHGQHLAIPAYIRTLPNSDSVKKVLVRFATRMAKVYDTLVAPPATERGRIENAMVKAKHDRFISFLR